MTESPPMAAAGTPASRKGANFARSMRPRTTAPFLRKLGVFAKDITQHARILVTMIIATLMLTYLPWLAALVSMQTQNLRLEKLAESAPSIYLAMLITCSFVFGLVVSAAEVEERTIRFLDVLPASRMRHFVHKFGAALLMLIVWAISAALLMGLLTGSGTRILHSIVHDRVSLFSVLNVPSSGFLTILQCVSLTLTGLVCGLLFANIAPAAIVGVLAYCVYFASLSWIFDRNFIYQSLNEYPTWLISVHTIGFLAWCGGMVAAYPRLFRQWHMFTPGSALRRESTSGIVQRVALAGTLFRSNRLGFDAPQGHLLRIPTVLVALFALLFPILFMGTHPWIGNGDERLAITYMWLLPAAAALIATGAWLQEERFAPKFEFFALPATRERWFWLRTRALFLSSMIIAACCGAGVVVAEYLRNQYWWDESLPWRNPGEYPRSLLSMVPILAGIFGGLTSLMQLAAMYRLFFRSRMIAGVFAGITIIVWGGCSAASMVSYAYYHGYNVRDPASAIPWGAVIYALWIAALTTGLPIVVSYLAFCRTRLLETSEKTRGSLALMAFVILFFWGTFLITAEPGQLLTILFVH